ncbi:MAG TPA: LysR family transcriptional regulator [Steroidobacteraceae bacterium]|nr:LysR family transcriptional regulator [Steroidobacteraceae bacterium]
MFQPRLEMRHLRMLQAMARTGSVTRAAAMLGLTQSALSHQIREAERRLGLDLFIQRDKRMQMTPIALTLSEEAGRILAQLERLEQQIARDRGVMRHIVRIGCGAYSGYRWLPRFLKVFQQHAADIDIEVVADATQRPLQALQDRDIDVAVSSGTPDKSTTRSLRLFRDELVLIMAPSHPLAGKEVIVAQDLSDQVYISYSAIAEKGHEYERFMKPAQVSYRSMLRVELTEAIVELVIGGFGISILSRWAVNHYLQSGALASARVTRKGLHVDWYAATRKSEPDDGGAWRMATALKNWCEQDRYGFAHELPPSPDGLA